jgi:glycosyltransferase involved in cell wall biosynthesis
MVKLTDAPSGSLKIAQVVSTPPFAWATGGCARVTYDLSRALANRGHSVDILSTDLHTPDRRRVACMNPKVIDGIRIFNFPCLSQRLAWKYKFYFSPRLTVYLKKHVCDYDIVHLEDLISPLAIATAKYCVQYDIPYVLTTHGSLPWLQVSRLINRIYSSLYTNKILKNASRIFVLNPTEAEICKSFGINDEQIEIIPNGLNISEYESPPPIGQFKSKFGIPMDKKIVLYLGRLNGSKGIDLLVDAYSDMTKKVENTRLVIAGPDDGHLGELLGQTNELGLCDNTVFTSYLSSDDKLAALVDAEVLVIPKFTGFPVTFLEACACGTPIVTTDAGDRLDWIKGNVGEVVEYKKEQLRDAIVRIVTNEQVQKKYSENGKKMVNELFDWNVLSGKIEQIYVECFKDEEIKSRS